MICPLFLFLASLLKSEGSSLNDSNVSATSAGGDSTGKPSEFEFARAAAEIKELREEGSQLRQENIELKVSPIFFCLDFKQKLSKNCRNKFYD